MVTWFFRKILERGERRCGVTLDYARHIAAQDAGLFMRYGKIFSFLDPNEHLPAEAYHAARICGALAADCGTCLEAEINLARRAGVGGALIRNLLSRDTTQLTEELAAVVRLSSAVTSFGDHPDARRKVLEAYGEAGLIELAYAMNGAALLPGIKRAMGYATACDLELLQKQAG
jgi:hypothetical protein